MNSIHLFFMRLIQNGKYQYNIVKTIADWTVMLYILIPSAIFASILYRSWWDEIPHWIEFIPFSIMFLVLFFFIWGGHFRTYVREADRIFLMKNRRLYIDLKQNGIFYSYVIHIVHTVLLGFLVAPFWLNHYHAGIGEFVLYLAFFLSSKWLIMGVKGILDIDLHGWRSALRSIPLLVGMAIVWVLFYNGFQSGHIPVMIGLIILNSLGSVLFIKDRFLSIKTFDQDHAIEELERNKYVGLIFGISMDVEKPPKPLPPRKGPILYSQSNRLFKKRTPKTGLLELFIKATTRNTEYILRYLQIIGVTSLAIILIPSVWYKVAITLSGFLFVRTWIRIIWDEVVGSHMFTRKYANKDAYFTGKRIVTTIFSLLFLCLTSVFFIVRSLLSFLI